MRALVWDGSTARVLDHPEPAAGEHMALVRVHLAGVCNTDLEIAKGYMGFRGVLGHELVGTVEDGPQDWRGKRVVCEINFACGLCETCRAGLPRHCPERRVMGILGADGAFAERLCVPVGNLHAVPEGVSDEAAVFAEPLAAAFEILEQVSVVPDADCVVLGGGLSGIDLIYRDLPAALRPHVFNDEAKTPVRRNLLGDSSGVRGAALLWDD